MSEPNSDGEKYSDDDLHSYEVVIRSWGPDHEPGEADYNDYLVEAADREEAKELAWEEAEMGHYETGEVVQADDLGLADEQLVADGGEQIQTVSADWVTGHCPNCDEPAQEPTEFVPREIECEACGEVWRLVA